MQNLTLLALDTSTEACSVALLYRGEKTHINELAQRTHTKRILPMIDEILANSGLGLNQVDALAFGRGPGSFTGVRVGAGIAQGLAFGADLPVIPISNLTAMAQAAFELHQAENVVAAIDARMNEVYFSQVVREKCGQILGNFFNGEKSLANKFVLQNKRLTSFKMITHLESEQAGLLILNLLKKNLTGSDIALPNALYMLELAQVEYLQNTQFQL